MDWCGVSLAGATHGRQVLLGEALVLPAQLDHLAHLQGDPLVVELLCLAVQLGRVLGHQVLLVLTRRPCGGGGELTENSSNDVCRTDSSLRLLWLTMGGYKMSTLVFLGCLSDKASKLKTHFGLWELVTPFAVIDDI